MSSATDINEATPRDLTRRRLIGGIAAAGAASTLAGPLLAARAASSAQKPCVPDAPGVPTAAIAITPDGRTVWSTDTLATTITAHRARDLQPGRSIDVGGAPIGIAISHGGDLALVTTAFYDRPGLALVNLHTGHVDRVKVGPEPGAVVFAPNGRSAYVAGGGAHGTLTHVNPSSGHVHAPIALGGAHPRGLALLPDGKHALVALNGASEIAVVALARRQVVRRIKTAAFPAQLAISPDGEHALVTHNGFGARAVTLIDVHHRHAPRRLRVGHDPAGVAFARSGKTALVTAAGSGTVTLLDVHTGHRRRTATPGGAPRGIAIAGRRAIVADGRTGQLTAIRLGVLR